MIVTKKIRGYAIDAALGTGGFGEVWRAQSPSGGEVALKVVDYVGTQRAAGFEAQLLQRLKHPNIVQCLDHFFDSNQVYLVMQYLGTISLADHLESHEKCDVAEILEFLRQMASALSYAHGLDIVHRDIKPANIMKGPVTAGQYVIIDFGIARSDINVLAAPRQAGTYRYMAPEQRRGRPMKASDMWAVGAIAYEMLTGRPLRDSGPSVERLSALAPDVQLPPPCTDLESRLGEALRGLLEADPNLRWTADDLCEFLNKPLIVPKFVSVVMAEQSRPSVWAKMAIVAAVMVSLPAGLVGGLLMFWGIVHAGRILENHCEKNDPRKFRMPPMLLVSVVLLMSRVIRALLAALLDFGIPPAIYYVWGFVGGSLFFWAWGNFQDRKFEVDWSERVNLAGDAEALVAALGALCEEYPGDPSIRVRYAEALLLRGEALQAAAQAAVALDDDRYNFAGNLILANALLEIGLIDLCKNVCRNYLSAVNYAFEFKAILALALESEHANTSDL